MPAGAGWPNPAAIEILRAAIKGVKNEILLYGIFVITVLFLSGWYGIEMVRELKLAILGFATLILVMYFSIVLINLWREWPGRGPPTSRKNG
jgi:hypothetical protein